MFCDKCGKVLPEGVTECDVCNAQAAEPTFEAPVEAPVEVYAEAPVYAEPTFEAPAPAPKKSKKGLIGILIAAVAVIASAALVICNWPWIKGTCIKTFGSDEDYFQFVEKTAISKSLGALTSYYGAGYDLLSDSNIGANSKISLVMSDEAKSMLESFIPAGADMDMDFLSNVACNVDFKTEGNNMGYTMGLSLNDTELLTLEIMMNVIEGEAYMGIPNLSDEYISIPMENTGLNVLPDNISEDMFGVIRTVMEALPDGGEVEDLLEKYIGIALESLGEVELSEEEVEIGDYSETLTVIEYTVTYEDLQNIAVNVLTELEQDSDIEGYIIDAYDVIVTEFEDLIGKGAPDADEVYKEFQDIIGEALKSVEKAKVGKGEICTIVDYVNGSHEIVGRELIVEKQSLFKYVTVNDGGDFAFEGVCEAAGLLITGEGQESGNVVTGEYTVEMRGHKLVTIGFEDFDFDAVYEGKLDGTISIKPSGDLLDEMDIPKMFSSIALKMTFDTDTTGGTVDLGLYNGDTALINLLVEGENTSGNSVSMPDDALSSSKIEQWVKGLDTDKLISSLEDAGLPNELIKEIKNALKNIQ